jgi:hypothetical protein
MAPDDLHDAPDAPGEAAPAAPGEAAPDAPGEAAPAVPAPDAALDAPGAPAAAPPDPEPEAWARVVAAWGDEKVHQEYLARFRDLEGLAVAGGRYRAVLDARPDDAVARRFRDEVVKRATAAGLALVPRTRLPAVAPRALKVVAVGLLVALLVAVLVLLWRDAALLLPGSH